VKTVDRVLQRWRIRKAMSFIPPGARVLDIGCADGVLFRMLGDRIAVGVGIDPDAEDGAVGPHARIYRGLFPVAVPDIQPFDVICLLAVLEHIPEAEQQTLTKNCYHALNPGGVVVVTVPAPAVDAALAVLRALRLIDGMSLEQHYGFNPARLPELFESSGLSLIRHRRFQMGFNHLFAFRRSG
jgi:2-polyprenyl-3-methyl-5-hydroxy-6-metoxy-1,4-benzoquinol methylase